MRGLQNATGLLACVVLARSGAAQQPVRAELDRRLRFGSGMGYTLGSYGEVEGQSTFALPVGGRWRVDATYAVHGGNDRITGALSHRWALARQLELHLGAGGFWLPPSGFEAENHRAGGMALVGLEQGPHGWFTGLLGLDTWLYAEATGLTQRTVHVPLALGLRFSFRRGTFGTSPPRDTCARPATAP